MSSIKKKENIITFFFNLNPLPENFIFLKNKLSQLNKKSANSFFHKPIFLFAVLFSNVMVLKSLLINILFNISVEKK